MLSLRDLTYTEIAIRIILSVLFGGILGMERGMKNRGAGLCSSVSVPASS